MTHFPLFRGINNIGLLVTADLYYLYERRDMTSLLSTAEREGLLRNPYSLQGASLQGIS